jgi:hypothetical protein
MCIEAWIRKALDEADLEEELSREQVPISGRLLQSIKAPLDSEDMSRFDCNLLWRREVDCLLQLRLSEGILDIKLTAFQIL